MTLVRRLVGALCASALACSAHGGTPGPSADRAHLPVGTAARVGSEEVALKSVSRISRSQAVSPAVARDRAVSDALFSAAARATLNVAVISVVERGALARAVLERLKADALALGPASDAEVAELTARRWQELDRPETVRTTHVVVKAASPAADTRAREIAQRIREAVSGITDSEQFMRVARAVPHEGTDLRAEHLPAITADGRTYYPNNPPPDAAEQRFDLGFAAAAHALRPGQISEPTKTSFGYHVILCEERLPEQRVPLEQRRARLYDQVVKGRAERAKQELLARLGAARPTSIDRAGDDLTARVRTTE